MASCYHTRFVSSIMLDGIYEVDRDSLEFFSWMMIYTLIFKGVIVINLVELELCRSLPFGVAIGVIKFDGLVEIARHLMSVHVDGFVAE